jgi:hypothetical protein
MFVWIRWPLVIGINQPAEPAKKKSARQPHHNKPSDTGIIIINGMKPTPTGATPKKIPARTAVRPHRTILRIKSSFLFSPVTFESYPLNHHAIAGVADSRMMFTKIMNEPIFNKEKRKTGISRFLNSCFLYSHLCFFISSKTR